MKPHRFLDQLRDVETAPLYGHVEELAAGLVRASGPAARLGQLCEIGLSDGRTTPAEVVAVSERGITLIPLELDVSLALGARVTATPHDRRMLAGDGFAGRAVDALGRPIDGAGPVAGGVSHISAEVSALDRVNPATVMATGVRAIDGLLTLGVGQRIGIFAASGVGKTSLIEQLAAQIDCDRCILCLVGERGREVSGLWDMAQATAAPERFTLVAATSDESPVMRARAVDQALALADHWRARGEHVVLMLDSITRLAMALREIGLAAGAPPTVRAYTPNVFAALPRIVERCGAVRGGGAITAIMTVLSETDDVDDPIVEVMKSLLDGHIVLSRLLADQGHFPAIDIVRSVSRQAARLVEPDHLALMRNAVGLLAAYDENRVMIESGVYRARSNERIDAAIAARAALAGFLRQPNDEAVAPAATLASLRTVPS
ncbi:FliI/YscN family ATPase [Sphingomonas sp.]|jgi:flagellum-specific ATP synthase|uniref:FliI/YscN family ATPase n=1 Tax=Sphingomonas sp. TaxID=28214 RepID=UPI002E3500FE|nr:FliI/YscN family ATPase [Sphingomonas sp.]HEX4695796.1 FliI/YscN family ATPase [Sphingomonas sp.]